MSSTSFFKKILALAAPMAGSQFINVASSFLCMSMLAALGHDVLAASALIFTTQISIVVTGMSILFSLSVLVGHAYGARQYSAIGNYLQQSWTLALLISIPVMLFFWHVDYILLKLHQSPHIVSMVRAYFHTYVWAMIPGFLATCNMQFGYGLQRKKLMFFISLSSVTILVLSAYAFIFGKFGAPKVGLAGLGIAITLQYSYFFIVSTLFFALKKDFKSFELFHYRVHKHLDHFKQMFKIGWPICVQIGGEMLSFFVGGILVGWLGNQALAAYQIGNQYYMLIVVPIFSLSQATGILVGHASGANQIKDIKRLSYTSILLALFASSIVAGIFLFFPKHLASAYLDIDLLSNAKTLHYAILVFSILAFSQLFDALRNIFIGILRGLFDTRFAMLMSLCSIWLCGMPLSYLLAFLLHLGIVGFALGGMVGMLVGASVMGYRWYFKI